MIVERDEEMTPQEEEEFLNNGDYWHPDYYTPEEDMYSDLDDGMYEPHLRGQASRQTIDVGYSDSSSLGGFTYQEPKLSGFHFESKDDELPDNKLLVRDDDDGLGTALSVDIPDHRTASASDLCR